MTSTFYIDTNRQNSSHKSIDTNNEWTYKLSNAIQIPEGSEIAIQDTFIHKQGISGSTIEILEDIKEEIWFSYYLSDNPHFVPRANTGQNNSSENIVNGRSNIPSFVPSGPLNCNFTNKKPFQFPEVQLKTYGTGNVFKTEYLDAGANSSMSDNLTIDAVTTDGSLRNPFHNSDKYFAHPRPSQRSALFEDDTEGNPRLNATEFCLLNDPYYMGYTEYPMMAVYADSNDTYNTVAGELPPNFPLKTSDNPDLPDTNCHDPRLKPLVNSVEIFIPKGVYAVGEIADIIEKEINGAYANVANDDFYTDGIIEKQNKQQFDGNINQSNIYVRCEAFDRCGGYDAVDGETLMGQKPDEMTPVSHKPTFNKTNAGYNPVNNAEILEVDFDEVPEDDVQTISSRLNAVFSMASNFQQNDTPIGFFPQGLLNPPRYPDQPNQGPYTTGFPPHTLGTYYGGTQNGPNHDLNYGNVNPTGSIVGGHPINDRYSMPYYRGDETATIQYRTRHGLGHNSQQVTIDVPAYLLHYNKFQNGGPYTGDAVNANGNIRWYGHNRFFNKGRKPRCPSKKHIMYIPTHYYNQMIKMYIHNDVNGQNDEAGTTRAGINAYLVKTSNWTVDAKNIFRYGIQTRLNCYGKSNCNANGQDAGTNDFFIGLHLKMKTNSVGDVINNTTDTTNNPQIRGGYNYASVSLTPTQYQYDVMKEGYFLGTPDFTFNYDQDMSAFKIQGLHQSLRIPSCDQEGNPMTNEGQSAVYLRRTAENAKQRFTKPERTTGRIAQGNVSAEFTANFNRGGGATGFEQKIKNCLNNNEDRLGGVAIYNWAYQTALKYGDVNPETHTLKDYLGNTIKAFDTQYTNLWTYDDFFSSKAKAKEAWEKTLWSKLGFSYDNLQSKDSWETCAYYDLPTTEYSNYIDPNAGATTQQQQRTANFYKESRSGFFFENNDFKVYGKTTKGEIGADSIPSVSTTFNNSLYQYTPNPATNPQSKPNQTLHQIVRTYDNHNTVTPFFGKMVALMGSNYLQQETRQFRSNNTAVTEGLLVTLPKPTPFSLSGGPPNVNSNVIAFKYGTDDKTVATAHPNSQLTNYSYDNSMYHSKTRVPILSQSKAIVASGLPQLSNQGYYVITSDIIDGFQDDIKQGSPIPIMGIVPISNLSNQDFITSKNDIIHTTQATKTINSIKIKILNPDLTSPKLLQNSSVIFRITVPIPQNNPTNPEQSANQQSNKKSKQPKANDDKTKSGGV